MKFWNYIFYSTFKFQVAVGNNLIFKPISYVLGKIPALAKNKTRGAKAYDKIMNSEESSFNIAFAFQFMFLSTTILIGILLLYISIVLNFEWRTNAMYAIVGAIALSYSFNYFMLTRKDRYINYFKEFSTNPNIFKESIFCFLFHSLVWIAFVGSLFSFDLVHL